jgi:phosphoribosylformylglycinamidine synthase II
MFFRVEVENKPGVFDAAGASAKKEITDLSTGRIKDVKIRQIYILYGNLTKEDVERIADEVLIDKITQRYRCYNQENLEEAKKELAARRPPVKVVEVAYNLGVMDPWEESIKKAISDFSIKDLQDVKTAKQYIIDGAIDDKTLDCISEKTLYNKLIQHVRKPNQIYSRESYLIKESPKYRFKIVEVDILKKDDNELMRISREGQLFLNLDEMKMIQKCFRNLGRNPSDCELETIAQTWSEHCYHKTFRSQIEYEGKIIDGLLQSTIMQATKMLDKEWCVSVFKDNSGIIKFNDDLNVCFKVETHNHPSALEPYGGASTGVGGVIRDVLGTGLGAKPIASTDVFCFGLPDYSQDKLSEGILHPKRVIKGVVSGVRDYGNRMGIPTVNGAVLFNEGYTGNPLIYCGSIGIMPKDKSFKKIDPGDLIVVIGGRTGRDGIHGATFSSGELSEKSEELSSSAVQIGNAIQQKKMLDCLLKVRDKNLYKAITDCGAGGLSSAVGETASETGAKVDLEKAPLKYQGLSYTEIWISESQERMVLAVDKEKIDQLIGLFKDENVEATAIGEYTETGRLELFYEDRKVCDLDMQFLHKGIPQTRKKAVWKEPRLSEPDLKEESDYTETLNKLLATYDIASKEWMIRQYDHEVQGKTILKPLGGKNNDGPNDAACLKPLFDSFRGLIVSCGINPYYGMIDPYWMAINVVDEALRQIIASGGNLERVAILDNFCWGSPENEELLGELTRACIGCYDASVGYQTPFISGKDSLNNEFKLGNKTISIPGTLLISSIAVIEDIRSIVSSDFKKENNPLYLVGVTKDELGGSAYYRLKGLLGKNVPKGKPVESRKIMQVLAKASSKGLVRSCHDCSEGGLAVSIAEMAFSGGLGAEINLACVPAEIEVSKDYKILFSESMSRFIVEVDRNKQKDFEGILADVPCALIGKTTRDEKLKIKGLDGKLKVNSRITDLKESWQRPLRW